MNLDIREIELRDIQLIIDYWLKSDKNYLISLGVDLNKLPSENQINTMLTGQINTDLRRKQSYALIWEINNVAIGHCNVNNIKFGEEATMHLHIWRKKDRKKGVGFFLLNQSLEHFFKTLNLKKIICEPYAENNAPNRTLKKAGFKFIKSYKTIPGSLNFEQEVNRWEISK
mgnify:CR=1 FL=1